MPDYLDALIGRSLNPPLAVRPRVPSLFEPVRPGFGPGGGPFVEAEEGPTESPVRQPPIEAREGRPMLQKGRDENPLNVNARLNVPESPIYDREPPMPLRTQGGLTARLDALEKRLREGSQRSVSAPGLPSTGAAPLPSRPGVIYPSFRAEVERPPSQGDSRDVEPTDFDHFPSNRPDLTGPAIKVAAEAQPRSSYAGLGLPERAEALERAIAVQLGRAPRTLAPGLLRPARTPVPPTTVQPATSTITPQRQPTPVIPRPGMQPVRNTSPQTLVQVSIGRVEVRAVAAETSRRDVPGPPIAPTGLEAYLRRRNGGEP
jgi:hypothetical protein